MESRYPVRMVSGGERPSVHTYYDICPESPDGTRVAWFAFSGQAIPGPGRVMLADRDGGEARTVGPEVQGIGHVGAFVQWIDDDTLAFEVTEPDRPVSTRLARLSDGSLSTLSGRMRQFSPCNGLALVSGLEADTPDDPVRSLSRVAVTDLRSGAARGEITRRQAAELYPRQDVLPAVEQTGFANTKWSPDGTKFFMVFSDEYYRIRGGQTYPSRRMKCLYVADADGTNLRFLGDFTHHPMWMPDGKAVIAMQSRGNQKQDLLVYPLDGRPPYPLIEHALGVHSSLHPDGRRLVVDVYQYPGKGLAAVLLYDTQTKSFEAAASFRHGDTNHQTGHHVHPVWSRDWRRVYFNAADTGIVQLYAMEPAGPAPRNKGTPKR